MNIEYGLHEVEINSPIEKEGTFGVDNPEIIFKEERLLYLNKNYKFF